jgi:hypothetical protein
MGISARQAPFWSVSSSLLTGTSSAVAVISSFGQLGGFAGPYIVGFLTDRTGTYAAGTFYLIGSAVVAGGLMLLLKLPKRTLFACQRGAHSGGGIGNLSRITSVARHHLHHPDCNLRHGCARVKAK